MSYNTLTDVRYMATAHLLSEGFTLDGTDPRADLLDALQDWVLYNHEGYTRWVVDNAYDLVGGYDALALHLFDHLS